MQNEYHTKYSQYSWNNVRDVTPEEIKDWSTQVLNIMDTPQCIIEGRCVIQKMTTHISQTGWWGAACVQVMKIVHIKWCDLKIDSRSDDLANLHWLKYLLKANPKSITINGAWSEGAMYFLFSNPEVVKRLMIGKCNPLHHTLIKELQGAIPIAVSLKYSKLTEREALAMVKYLSIGKLVIKHKFLTSLSRERFDAVAKAINENSNICMLNVRVYNRDKDELKSLLSEVVASRSIAAIKLRAYCQVCTHLNDFIEEKTMEALKAILHVNISVYSSEERVMEDLDIKVDTTKSRKRFEDWGDKIVEYNTAATSPQDGWTRVKMGGWFNLWVSSGALFDRLVALSRFTPSPWFDEKELGTREFVTNTSISMQSLWLNHPPFLMGMKLQGSEGKTHILDLPSEIIYHIMTFVPISSVNLNVK